MSPTKADTARNYAGPGDVAIDDAVIGVMEGHYGDRVRQLPPVALVIAAYN